MNRERYCLCSSNAIKTKRNLVYLLSLICVAAMFLLTSNFKLKKSRVSFTPIQLNMSVQKVNFDLVLHSAYFDKRPQNSHGNATVVLMSVLKEYRDEILGCEVDGNIYWKTDVVDIYVIHWILSTFKISHIDCVLYCYDAEVKEDSVINVLYNKSGTIDKETVLRDILIPNYETEEEAVMVCATGFGEVQHLDEWLTYQRTIGVKFIHLNVNPSFLINLNKSSLLQNLTDTGYVAIVTWEDSLNDSQVYYHSQSLKYQDCVFRYQGKYKYMMVIDFDEFFIPLSNDRDILSHAKFLLKQKYGSVELPRREYSCKATGVNENTLRDGNLTKMYDTSESSRHGEGKSIYLLKAVLQSGIHEVGHLLPNYKGINYRRKPKSSIHCYVAHFLTQGSKNWKPCRH